MTARLQAFQVEKDNAIFDYRLEGNLDLTHVKTFFTHKGYKVLRLTSAGRHVIGRLEKEKKQFFLKLATAKGVSIMTESEALWNVHYNKLVLRKDSPFWVPNVFDQGYYQGNLFYLITDVFEGEFLAKRGKKGDFLFEKHLALVIAFAEHIQNLSLKGLKSSEASSKAPATNNHKVWFLAKTKAWYEGIPQKIRKTYGLHKLFEAVKEGIELFGEAKPRHGDYAPWHIILLPNGKLGLIDGEHALSQSVEYYDIRYVIQRVFSVLENIPLARRLYSLLVDRGYDRRKMKVVLAARAIGGFLDASVLGFSTLSFAEQFKEMIFEDP